LKNCRHFVSALLLLLSTSSWAQTPLDQLIGHATTPTGYINPVGSDGTVSHKTLGGKTVYCSGWLSRDPANGGCYLSPYYHTGQDILVSTPTYLDGTPNGIGHLVYAIADGEIEYVSQGVGGTTPRVFTASGYLSPLLASWGTTNCILIKSTIPGFDPGCGIGQRRNNVAIAIKHKIAGSSAYFLAIYGHVIDYNLLTQRPFENSKGNPLPSAVKKGQAFAIIGDWESGIHLHFGIKPAFDPQKSHPPAKWGLANDTDASDLQYSHIDPTTKERKYLTVDWTTDGPNLSGLSDPPGWLASTTPDNYITQQTTPAIIQIGTPESIVLSLGGVVAVPWQVQSLGATGTIQGNVVVTPDLSNSSLKIKSVIDRPRAIAPNQTTTVQQFVYAPSRYVEPGAYFANIQTQYQLNGGALYSPSYQPLQIQIAPVVNNSQPHAIGTKSTVSAATVPVITASTVLGSSIAGSIAKMAVLAVGSAIDPSITQALLYGPACPDGCASYQNDITATSFAAEFDVPSQAGTYVFKLRNGQDGAFSNSQDVLIETPLVASCSPSVNPIAQGAPTTFTGVATGGSPPYSFNWDGAAAFAGKNLTVAFASGGTTATLQLDVTDEDGNRAQTSCTATVSLGLPSVSVFGILSAGATAGTPFDGAIAGNSFDTSGSFQVSFCQLPNNTICYRQPAAGIAVSNDASGAQAILTSMNLPSGQWDARVRNGASGVWSNFSNTFNVAPKPATPLSVTCTPSPTTINEGQLTTFKALPLGISPFKFVWTGAVSGTSQNIAKTFAVSGLYSAQVTVSDASGSAAQTASCTLQVNSAPPPPTAPIISSLDLPSTPVSGANFGLSFIGSGFVSDNLQVWFFGTTTCLSGCRQPDAGVHVDGPSSATIINIQLGLDSYRVKVRNGDLGPWSGASSPFQTISASAPNFGLGVVNATVTGFPGQIGTFDVSIGSRNGFGGTATWQVFGLPATATVGNPTQQVNVTVSGTTFTIGINISTAVSAGAYPLVVKVISGSLFQSLALTLNVTVPPISGSCSANSSLSPITVNSGVPLNYVVTPSGGRSPYHYSWIGVNGAGDVGSLSVTPSGLASIDVFVQVTDSNTVPLSTTVSCPRVTINPPPQPLAASCSALQNPITLGQQVDFEASISGGTIPYRYLWSGLFSSAAANALGIPGVAGTFTETLVLTDNGTPVQSKTVSCSVTVNPSPDISVQGFTTNVFLQQGLTGGPFQVAVTPTNGFTGLVTMNISGQPFGVTINPASANITGQGTIYLSSNVTAASNASIGSFSLTATVGNGINNKTVALSLTITLPPLIIGCSIAPNPLNLGSGGTLSASASGGSGGYQYNLNSTGYQSFSSLAVFGGSVGTLTGTASVRDSQGTVASTSCSTTVQGVPPTISTFVPDTQPHNQQNFSGNVNGSGYVSGATVWFFGPGCTGGCQQPSAGVTVQSLTGIRVVNVRLGTGTYQVEVRTLYGSARSGNFSVLP
jgi:hypothetical protein